MCCLGTVSTAGQLHACVLLSRKEESSFADLAYSIPVKQLTHTNLIALITAGSGIEFTFCLLPSKLFTLWFLKIQVMWFWQCSSVLLVQRPCWSIVCTMFFCAITWESSFKDWTVHKVCFYMIESVSRQLTIFKLLNNPMLMK